MNENKYKEELTPREHGGGVEKNKIILLIVIILTLVVLFGGTYAIFGRIDEANVANNYKTGNLLIELDDYSEGLGGNLNMSSIPLSDEEGSALEPYKFKVINKGNLWYQYDLKLLTDMLTLETDKCTDNQIPLNYIKVKINDEEPQLLSEFEENKLLKNQVISASRERYYELRIWLDKDAPNSIIGNHFHGKVSIDGYAIQPFEVVNNFEYSGNYEKFTVVNSGNYKIELWGTGYTKSHNPTTSTQSGAAYTSGEIYLKAGEILYIYVGAQGQTFNYGTHTYRSTGGVATDVRYFGNYTPSEEELAWDSDIGLKSRIMVAAGPGSKGGLNAGQTGDPNAGDAGGLSGYVGGSIDMGAGGNGATQISGGGFGIPSGSNKGGTGYYAGYGGYLALGVAGAGGGSSFISGHTGCVAITSSESLTPRLGTNGSECVEGSQDNLCSIHYSGKYFTDTLMIDGKGFTWTNVKASATGTNLMPNPLGGFYESGFAHESNGHARITFVG